MLEAALAIHMLRFAGVQRVEIGDPVHAQDNGLAVDDKALLPVHSAASA